MPTPVSTPEPTEATCPKLDAAYVPPDITLDTTGGGEDIRMRLGVERAAAFAEPDSVWIGHPATSLNVGASVLVGGGEVGLGLNLHGIGFEPYATILGLTGVLRLDGQRPRPLDVRFVPSADGSHEFPKVRIPDVDGPATIEFRVEWVDRCFGYAATGGADFWIVSSATARACPKGSGFLDYVDARQPDAEVNGTPIRLRLTHQVSRFSVGAIAADGPALYSWQRTAPAVSGSAGTNARLTIGSTGFLLNHIVAQFYRRRDVTELLNGGDYPKPLFYEEATTTAAGALRLRVPADGRYVVALSFRWELPCALGSGVSVFSLDVE